ncbi:MAG: glycosyltransferase family 9 protein [Flavobacteriales bacterium]|nr:glycosyltransferase family 9 protein [Flavobacteriales bacterium]
MTFAGRLSLAEDARIILLQPAFLGDVVLSTALLESWHRAHPRHPIEMVVRQEAAGLLRNHPFLDKVHVWDRGGWGKYSRLIGLAGKVRAREPELVINLHRYASMALLGRRAGAPHHVGFSEGTRWHAGNARLKPHSWGDGRHETERNHALVQEYIGDWNAERDVPRLHPAASDWSAAAAFPQDALILAPSSVWATKRWPSERWSALADEWVTSGQDAPVVLLGGPADRELLEAVSQGCQKAKPLVVAGTLDLLGSAALMGKARAVVSNDSAPLHMAGAMNVPVVGVFCSTTPRFGFGPLPTMMKEGRAAVVEIGESEMDCKPCGPHGHGQCPMKHFRCGLHVDHKAVWDAVLSVSSPRRGNPTP